MRFQAIKPGQVSQFLRVIKGGYLAHYCPGCDMPHFIEIRRTSLWVWDGNILNPTVTPAVMFTDGARKHLCRYIILDGHIHFGKECTHRFKGHVVRLPPLAEYMREWTCADA